jgi:serine protease SohB
VTEFFVEYGLFLAKTLTVVLGVVATIAAAIGLSRRQHGEGGLRVEKLNDRFRDLARPLREALLPKADRRQARKAEKARLKAEGKARSDGAPRRRVFVLDFKGDIRATGVASLREEVTAVLGVAEPADEVVLRLENFGGAVYEHGLAASQLQRLRNAGIPLTAIVDKGAASGGYLMACIANRILAAPFAVIGSIGVLAQLPNFNRALEARGVDFEQVTAGRYKRTVTMFGRNTEEDRAKLKEELEEVHALFKQVVARHRPQLDVEAVATGEHWYGTRALELKLVDGLTASDDYLVAAARDADVLKLSYRARPTLQQRVLAAVSAGTDEVLDRLSQRNQLNRFP